MSLCAIACAVPALGVDWSEFRSGPFEVVSGQGERDARETLNVLEQVRYALGAQLGTEELQTTWPVRVVLTGKRTTEFPVLRLGRDSWICGVSSMRPETVASLVQVLLDSWPGYLPPNLRRGLISLYATIQVDGTRVTLGAPPAQKDRDWTRAHMLAVHPDYSGKVRVLLGNLGRGVEREVAYGNAFGQTPEQVEIEVNRYMEAGKYDTIPAPSRAISARQFLGKPLDAAFGLLATADLLLANEQAGAAAAYESALKAPVVAAEAREGLGLLAAKGSARERAKQLLADAKGARGQYEYARLLPEPADKRVALMKASTANPKWAEPLKLLAEIELHPAQKLAALRKAAQAEPRNPENWVALAVAQDNAKLLVEAGKSWAAAERATDDPAERERIRQSRLAGEQKRDEAVRLAREAERRKAEQEMIDLRNRALLEIRKAEAKANEGKPVIDASKLDEYKEGSQTKKVSGVLQRVDCAGSQARLDVVSGKILTRLWIADPNAVAIAGGGQRSFGCGVQKPARRVTVEYTPREDLRQGTSGDAVSIEFH